MASKKELDGIVEEVEDVRARMASTKKVIEQKQHELSSVRRTQGQLEQSYSAKVQVRK